MSRNYFRDRKLKDDKTRDRLFITLTRIGLYSGFVYSGVYDFSVAMAINNLDNLMNSGKESDE